MKPLILIAALAATLSGCATSSLLEDKPATATSSATARTTLIDDRVVAFGSPSQASGLSQSNVVIVGEKQSYVLTDGGQKLVNLLTRLEPKNIQVENKLEFFSAKNDGNFSGVMKLSYVEVKEGIGRNDIQFFLQNGGTECTTASDTRMGAARYCFDINIQGGVYPQVSNYDLVRSQFRPLTRPYSVSVYTQTTNQSMNRNRTGAEKLVLLPLALAFDVVTLPVQVLSAL